MDTAEVAALILILIKLTTQTSKAMSETLSESINLLDRISDLPDSLLCHILSFLETKQAVKTSILSKRWEFLWTYVDILEFNNHYKIIRPIEMQFAQFVNRVLLFHRAPTIKRMRLWSLQQGCNQYDIVTWIRSVVSRNLETLDLYLSFQVQWPICLFYSKTLVELKLTHPRMTNMNIPTAPFFPNLKRLHIYDYIFYESDSLKRFISGCLSLEYFFLQSLFLFRGEACSISSATLKTFSLTCAKLNFVLNTPSLQFLKICVMTDLVEPELSLESSLPYLQEAHISIDSYRSLSILEGFSNVAVLCLESGEFRGADKLDLPGHFHNLTKLELTCDQYGLDLLINFMEKSKRLKVIILETTDTCNENPTMWEEPQHAPMCLFSSLKTMCVKRYGNEEEVNLMIKYVLANAKVLEHMEIHTYVNDYKSMFHMLQKISKFRRTSEICELSFF